MADRKLPAIFQKTKQPNFCINCGHALSPLQIVTHCPSCKEPIKRIRISTLRQVKVSTQSVDQNLQEVLKRRQEKTNKHIVESPKARQESPAKTESPSRTIIKMSVPSTMTSPPPSRRTPNKEPSPKVSTEKRVTILEPKKETEKQPEPEKKATNPEPKTETTAATPEPKPEPEPERQETLEFEVVERDEVKSDEIVFDVIEEVEISNEDMQAIDQNNGKTEDFAVTGIAMGAASKRGKRKHNEDAHINLCPFTESPESLYLFGVFDGHGGKNASKFCQKKFSKILLKQKKLATDKATALYNTFLKVDEKYLDEFEPDGCTACVGLLTKDLKLTVANAGDSRCVVSKGGNVIQMSRDHKPSDKDEKARIEKAGHEVEMETVIQQGKRVQVGRVDGIQACSRSIGDAEFKDYEGEPHEQAVTCAPETKTEQLSKGDFIVCACDGLWDVMSNEAVVQYVKGYLGHYDLNQIAAALCLHAIEIGSDDNVSCVIVTC